MKMYENVVYQLQGIYARVMNNVSFRKGLFF